MSLGKPDHDLVFEKGYPLTRDVIRWLGAEAKVHQAVIQPLIRFSVSTFRKVDCDAGV